MNVNKKIAKYYNIRDILLDNQLLNSIILYHFGDAGVGNREKGGFDNNYIDELKEYISKEINNVVNETKEYFSITYNKVELNIKDMMNKITNELLPKYNHSSKLELEEMINTYQIINGPGVKNDMENDLNHEQKSETSGLIITDKGYLKKKYLKYKRKYLQLKYNR